MVNVQAMHNKQTRAIFLDFLDFFLRDSGYFVWPRYLHAYILYLLISEVAMHFGSQETCFESVKF